MIDFSGLVNPLDDHLEHSADEGSAMYQYFVKVVPTRYMKLRGQEVKTNQYSVTSHKRVLGRGFGETGLPGTFFMFELSPILVQLTETRRYAAQFCFLCRCGCGANPGPRHVVLLQTVYPMSCAVICGPHAGRSRTSSLGCVPLLVVSSPVSVCLNSYARYLAFDTTVHCYLHTYTHSHTCDSRSALDLVHAICGVSLACLPFLCV